MHWHKRDKLCPLEARVNPEQRLPDQIHHFSYTQISIWDAGLGNAQHPYLLYNTSFTHQVYPKP